MCLCIYIHMCVFIYIYIFKIPHISDIIYLTSFSVIISRSIHVVAKGIVSFFFMAE